MEASDNNYEDLIVHKKKIYAINRLGEIFRIIDSRMQLVKLPVPPCGNGDRKHLVECGGEIYVVNRLVDRSIRVIDFKVHRLDEGERRWVYVDNLGNYSFIVYTKSNHTILVSLFKLCTQDFINAFSYIYI